MFVKIVSIFGRVFGERSDDYSLTRGISRKKSPSRGTTILTLFHSIIS